MERDFEVRNGGTPHWHAAHLLALVGISFAQLFSLDFDSIVKS